MNLGYELEYLDNTAAAGETLNDEVERKTLIKMFEPLRVISLASWWKYFLIEDAHLSSRNLDMDHKNNGVLTMSHDFDLCKFEKSNNVTYLYKSVKIS